MYTLTRQEVAETLEVSTRSVDRYIKAGKLRSEKRGKIIYIHSDDVAKISGEETKQEVIVPNNESYTQSKKQSYSENIQTSSEIMDAQSRATLEKIYIDLRSEIKNKDAEIQSLSMKLGQAQEIAKNSVSLIEFKKSQFLLEESKTSIQGELENMKKQELELREKLKYEKSTNYLLIVFCLILLAGIGILWFIQI